MPPLGSFAPVAAKHLGPSLILGTRKTKSPAVPRAPALDSGITFGADPRVTATQDHRPVNGARPFKQPDCDAPTMLTINYHTQRYGHCAVRASLLTAALSCADHQEAVTPRCNVRRYGLPSSTFPTSLSVHSPTLAPSSSSRAMTSAWAMLTRTVFPLPACHICLM